MTRDAPQPMMYDERANRAARGIHQFAWQVHPPGAAHAYLRAQEEDLHQRRRLIDPFRQKPSHPRRPAPPSQHSGVLLKEQQLAPFETACLSANDSRLVQLRGAKTVVDRLEVSQMYWGVAGCQPSLWCAAQAPPAALCDELASVAPCALSRKTQAAGSSAIRL
jgi:hypothetical protein